MIEQTFAHCPKHLDSAFDCRESAITIHLTWGAISFATAKMFPIASTTTSVLLPSRLTKAITRSHTRSMRP
jgi:hypothetical protein